MFILAKINYYFPIISFNALFLSIMLCLEYLWGQSGVGLKPGNLWFLKVVGTAFEDRSAASPLSMFSGFFPEVW
ncbi:hypothetical protein M125_0765 [Bacteroides fragilis str. 3998T(B)3]|jgi:hypothetical protein|uniref:Transmembrane protein n=1 Tax=Bacteroides fragilis str. 3998T(B)3 TaxID=1339316 RepID=A0A015XIG2_BACFG|nr:hypothetical protein M077_0446 [Bacteroides fragilis str. 2-F-2 \